MEWQPIETAFEWESGNVILVCGHHVTHGYYVDVVLLEEGNFWSFDQIADAYIHESSGHTHWMPLPEPPK